MQKKIIVAIIINVIILSAGLGIIGHLTIDESIDRSLHSRLTLAGIIANNIDLLLERSLNRLYDISLSGKVDLNDNNWGPEREALRTAYQYSIFTDGIFLLDKTGNIVLTYPSRLENHENLLSVPYVSGSIMDGRPVISDIYTVEPTKKKVIYAMVPLKSKNGDVVGVAGGEIDPTNLRLSQSIEAMPREPNTYLEIIDSRGIIIVSNNPKRIFLSSDHNRFMENLITQKKPQIRTCHRCHSKEEQTGGSGARSTDILAFAPLKMAHWGVSIIQPEKDVFAPSEKLKKTFLAFSLGSIGIALIIAIGMSKSIVKPVHKLIDATHKIAEGDMSKSMEFGGVDEIGMLSSSFEIMRVRLADSLEGLRRYNVELEERVIERTKQIKASQIKVENLLKMVISAEEEERKRIARGLHDETMQTLSALLMKIDMCSQLYAGQLPSEKVTEMRNIAIKSLDEIHALIQNLRPTVVDDLGLEAGIRWLLDKHLTEKGITHDFTVIGTEGKRFNYRIETSLFRIIQEAVINISRHASAENVFIILKYMPDSLAVHMEDDGKGFDAVDVMKHIDDVTGLGILGMRERAYLVDGKLKICSTPGNGTRLSLWIPLPGYGGRRV
ncbi:MAG: HAMP domain-containing protein [Nitrospirae bacterium]|nr:MAG: HAMP domain-containing protein [Nitrospirota bacterium]